MFLDASAIVAVMTREDGWERFAESLKNSKRRSTSAVAIYEAGLAVARKRAVAADKAGQDVLDFCESASVMLIAIEAQDGLSASAVHQRFGKGRHPAALNMGDCFAYACAKRLGVPLLYKGDDFALTDIPSAMETDG